MVTDQNETQGWGPRPGEDWRAHHMRVFADYPEQLEVLRMAESREHAAEIWRERSIASHEGDPELQAVIRDAKIDYESTPEEDEEDIRIAREGDARGKSRPLEDVLRDLAKQFPEEAEGILRDL